MRREGAHPLLLLVLATLSQTGASMIQQGVAVVAVFVREALNLSLTAMGAIISATSLGLVVGLTFSGVLVDRRGPRWLQGWGSVFVLSFLLLLLFVHDFATLLVALFGLGVALSVVPAAGTRAIFEAFSGGNRGLMMGIRQSGVPLGSALSAVFIPWLFALAGLHGVWLGLALLFGLTSAAFCLALPRWREHRTTAPAFRRQSYVPALLPMLIGFMLVAGQYATLGFTIVDLHARLGWPIALAGAGLAVAQVGGGLGRTAAGLLSDRIGGRRPPVIIAVALLGVAMSLLMARLPTSFPAPLVFPLLFLLGCGTVGWNSLVLTWAGERVDRAHSGQAMSWTGSVIFLGSALYPPLFGHVVDVTRSFATAWSLLASWLLVAALLTLVASRKRHAPRPEVL